MINLAEIKRGMMPPWEGDRAWVYILVAAQAERAVKIGVSTDLFKRMCQSRSNYRQKNYPIFFHCAFQLPHTKNERTADRIEATCHARLVSWGVIGAHDWFLLRKETVEDFVQSVIVRRGLPIIRFPKVEIP